MDVVALRYTNPIGLLGWMYNLYISGNTEHTASQVRLFDRLVRIGVRELFIFWKLGINWRVYPDLCAMFARDPDQQWRKRLARRTHGVGPFTIKSVKILFEDEFSMSGNE